MPHCENKLISFCDFWDTLKQYWGETTNARHVSTSELQTLDIYTNYDIPITFQIYLNTDKSKIMFWRVHYSPEYDRSVSDKSEHHCSSQISPIILLYLPKEYTEIISWRYNLTTLRILVKLSETQNIKNSSPTTSENSGHNILGLCHGN